MNTNTLRSRAGTTIADPPPARPSNEELARIRERINQMRIIAPPPPPKGMPRVHRTIMGTIVELSDGRNIIMNDRDFDDFAKSAGMTKWEEVKE